MSKNLILLHAALGSKDQFKDFIKILPSNWKIWSFDFEGHGSNTSDRGFSMQTFVGNILDFMKEQHIEKSYFFGYSMGGYVALWLARLHPKKVQGIITLATKFEWTPSIVSKETLKLQADLIEKKVPSFAEILKNRHNDWKAVLHKTAKLMTQLGDGEGKLKEEDLTLIAQKVLVCLGDKDQMISVEESMQAANSLPNSSIKLIENLNHSFEKLDDEKYMQIYKLIKMHFHDLD